MCKFYSIIHEEPGLGYSAEVPALPAGCYTDGATIEEVRANLKEAIQLHLEVKDDEIAGMHLPETSRVMEVAA